MSLLAAVSPSEAQAMIDHAARQSDRWLFLATAGVFACCLAGAVIFQTRWVQSLVQELRQDRRDLGEIVKANTIELVRVRDVMERK